MSRSSNLISSKEYQDTCAAKCHYNGFVYDPDGYLLNVENKKQTIICDKPECPDLYYTKDTRFVRHEYVTKITVLELAGSDFVFGMGGEFIEEKSQSDPTRKGEIYIRQVKEKRSVTKVESEIFEDVKIKDMKNMLSPEAYSKIFTCIIGLLMRNELKMLRNQKISVQRMPVSFGHDKIENSYNLNPRWEEEWSRNKYAMAFYLYSRVNDHIVTAIVRGHNADNTNLEHYSTIWNVINLLGAHELITHAVIDSFNDAYGTHYLAYGHQMKHETWKYTTQKFQEETRDSFFSFYNRSRKVEKINEQKGIHQWLEGEGLFQYEYYGRRADSLFYQNSISPWLEDTSKMKLRGEEIKQFPEFPINKRK